MKLSNKSLEFLRSCLAEPGWNKGDSSDLKHQRFYISAKLCAEVLPEVPEMPLPIAQAAAIANPVVVRERDKLVDALYRQEVEFELNEKQTECVKACLKFFIDEDRMPHTLPGLQLCEAFNLFTK